MKKYIITFFLAANLTVIFAQDTIPKANTYRNEFGLDVTCFFKQFVNLNNQQYQYNYAPIYYLSYRRHFIKSNLRFAIGGDYENTDLPTGMYGSTTTYNHVSVLVGLRLGYEFFNNLSKRWQVFYGLDVRPAISYDKNEYQYWNNPSAGYINGMETRSQTYGCAPLLGFRFRITDRLSLLTESSFSINFEQKKNRQFFNPVSNQYPALQDVVSRSKKIYTGFFQPLSLFLTFDI